MRTFGITLAVCGVAAAVATFALNALPSSVNLASQLTLEQTIDNIEVEFQNYAANYGKNYETVEDYQTRLAIFRQNKIKNAQLNAQNSGAEFGITQFSDWTLEEFKAIQGAKDIDLSEFPEQFEEIELEQAVNGPIDWRSQGKVNAVKNQGNCGSCWAFSATATMESIHAINKGQLNRLSEQEVVDCSHTGNNGCSGGMYDRAWNDMQKLGGFQTESSYPYTAKAGTCRFNKGSVAAIPAGQTQIRRNDPNAIKAALVNGPVSIALAAGNPYFQGYKGGVLSDSRCPTQIDHAVVAVGWGTTGSQDYFIIRNSWGASWGEQGHIRIAAASGAGVCGMNTYPAQVKA